MISLATSLINQQVRDNIQAALDENRLGGGRFIKEFEEKVASFLRAKYTIAVCNGTMADTIAIASLKFIHPKKTEVIVPALTFTAQVAAIIHNGLTPIFVDVDENFQMDLTQVEDLITDKTLAIMAVHLLGKECDIEIIRDIADRNNILFMEDCCEAYGGEYKSGGMFGTGSSCGTFSFFPSHTITTGEGGMIATDDLLVADMCSRLANHGRLSDDITEKFHFRHIGFNGKISNVLAAIGAAVTETADDVIIRRRANVNYINKFLKKDWYASSPHCYPILLDSREARDNKLRELQEHGIESRKLFSSLPTQELAYKHLGYELGDFPVAEDVGDRGMFLPIHQDLTEEDLEKICALILN